MIAPPCDQSAARKREGVRSSREDDGARRDRRRPGRSPVSWARTRSRMSARSAARARKYSSSARLVARDLLASSACAPGRSAGCRPRWRESALRQGVVLQHGDLEAEDLGGLALGCAMARRAMSAAAAVMAARSVVRSRARRSPVGAAASSRRRRAPRSARGRGRARPGDRRGGLGHELTPRPEPALDEIDQRGERRLARRRPRHGSTRSCPSAP